jgi:hypothetical protein
MQFIIKSKERNDGADNKSIVGYVLSSFIIADGLLAAGGEHATLTISQITLRALASS